MGLHPSHLRSTIYVWPKLSQNGECKHCDPTSAIRSPTRDHSGMAQVAVNLAPPESLSSSTAKRDSFLSSGRGGSGNIRRSYISTTTSERSPDLSVPQAPPRQRTSIVDKMRPSHRPARLELLTERQGAEQQQFTSSGRGGCGNIQPLTSDLEAHPLTASILSQHSAVQAQYEQRVRKVHAESNAVRSSGRGGSGNISDPRRRSRSQEPRTVSKRRFFTTKGRERSMRYPDGVTQTQDRQDRSETNRRTSHATYSSGGSSASRARQSEDSNAVTSFRSDVTSYPLPSEDAITGHSTRRQGFLTRHSKSLPPTSPAAPSGSRCLPSPTAPTYPRSWHIGSSGSSFRIHSSTSVILEDREYVSFLEL
ncbi:hypothetical protein J3R83DRAFT_7321 [Lanmaoa asiatica]|nr:hypothetical protein J3R83DRAFT_7321 [Lanmaoa asiatica]